MSTAPNPQPNIHIRHTAAEGTIASGDFGREDRPVHQALKSAGFRYSRNVGWYIQGSRDQRPRHHVINRAADALRALQFDVDIEIDETARPIAEREADRQIRNEDRVDALANKADRLGAESDRVEREIREKILDQIPFGQPILVGHHSEKRARRDLEKAQRGIEKSISLSREAEEADRKSRAAEQNQKRRESPGTTLRRIEKLEAEARKIDRDYLTPCRSSGKALKADAPDRESFRCPLCWNEVPVVDRKVAQHGALTGGAADRKRDEIAVIHADVAYWRQHLADLEADGVKLWGPDDFKKGDMARTRFGLREVVRVNKKSVSVKTDYSWTDTVPYNEVTGRVAKADLPDGL